MVLVPFGECLETESEVFNLKWEDIDIELRRLSLEVKKTRRMLELPLNENAFRVLEARLGMRHGPFVFYNPATGDRFKDVKLGLKAAVKRAGLSKITWHTFRHTFASRLTRSGVDIVTVCDTHTPTTRPRLAPWQPCQRDEIR